MTGYSVLLVPIKQTKKSHENFYSFDITAFYSTFDKTGGVALLCW